MDKKKLIRPLRFFKEFLKVEDNLIIEKDNDLWDQLFGDLSYGHLILGEYDEEAIYDALCRYGIFSVLKKAGLTPITVKIEIEGRHRQLIKIIHEKNGNQYCLGETILSEGVFKPWLESNILPCEKGYNMLIIQWVLLQNPFGKFTRQRPVLPGQKYPGLNIGKRVMEMMINLARRIKKDGIINRPEFIHNAWLYYPHFLYFDPIAEGKLEALKRDLFNKTLAEISWGFELGCIYDQDGIRIFDFHHGEQLLPHNKELQDYFQSNEYISKRDREYEKTKFYFDEDLFAQKNPLKEDGSLDISKLPADYVKSIQLNHP